jgi:hypothetical protein
MAFGVTGSWIETVNEMNITPSTIQKMALSSQR